MRHHFTKLILLTVLALGLTAFGSHVASHSADEQQPCELCTGQNGPEHAIPESAGSAPGTASPALVPHPGSQNTSTPARFHFRQRAPPSIV